MTVARRRAPLLLVTVGTDHHPFDRLVALGRRAGWPPTAGPSSRCVIQTRHLAAARRIAGRGSAYLELRRAPGGHGARPWSSATAGPATITEARGAGHRPDRGPPRPGLGEHVDDHQQLLRAAWLADGGDGPPGRDRGRAAPAAWTRRWPPSRRAFRPAPRPGRRRRRRRARFGAARRRRWSAPTRAGPPVPVPMHRSPSCSSAGSGRSGSHPAGADARPAPGRLRGRRGRSTCGSAASRDDERCGCGEPFRRCPFWRRSARSPSAAGTSVDVEPRCSPSRPRSTATGTYPGWPARGCPGPTDARLDALPATCSRGSTRAVRPRSPAASVVVDASKHASLAFAAAPGAPASTCGCCTWSGTAAGWPTPGPSRCAGPRWSTGDGLHGHRLLAAHGAALVGRRTTRCSTCSAGPGVPEHPAALRGLRWPRPGRAARPRAGARRRPDGRRARCASSTTTASSSAPSHTVAGNPMRFRTGRLALRVDEDRGGSQLAPPRTACSTSRSLTCAAAAARYGYLATAADE